MSRIVTVVSSFKDNDNIIQTPHEYETYVDAVKHLVEVEGYTMEESRNGDDYMMLVYRKFSDLENTPLKVQQAAFKSTVIGAEEYTHIHNYMKERVNLEYAQKMSGAAAETGVSYEDWLYTHNDVTSIPDLSNPDWNQSAGGHTWDMVRKIANGNDAYTKDDVIFLTYMMKHIVRAGAKPYEGKTDHESKVIDLRKAYRYLEAWLDILKGEVDYDKTDVRSIR